MSDVFLIFRKKLGMYFPGQQELEEIISDSSYVGDFLRLDESVTLKDLLHFIDTYEKSIIKSCMYDELLKNELLKEDNTVYRTEVAKITPGYFAGLFQNIRGSKFDYETVILFLDIIKLINIYGVDCEEEKLREVLESGIYATVKNISLVSDGDKILSIEELRDRSSVLLRWNQICGSSILDKVFSLETLLERLIELLESDRLELIPYKKKIENMIQVTNLGISIRDKGILPQDYEIGAINSVFANYEDMNKELLLKSLNQEDFSLIHFVQTEEVNYQLVENDVVDLNKSTSKEANFNRKQNEFFINSYLKNVKKEIEDKTSEPFDITNNNHRQLLQTCLDYYNLTFNNKPLERLPMDTRETGDNFADYVRPSSSRLSCSFVSKERMKTHLNRNIGLVIKPLSKDAILTMSVGYTSQKDYEDFQEDSVSYIELINQTEQSINTNETVVDATRCEVVSVVVLDKNEALIERANKLADTYHVPVITMELEQENIKDPLL